MYSITLTRAEADSHGRSKVDSDILLSTPGGVGSPWDITVPPEDAVKVKRVSST